MASSKLSSTKAKSQTLKQGTLSFASSKRTTSSNSVTKAKKPPQAKKPTITQSRHSSSDSSEDVSMEDVELTSDEEEKIETEERKQEGQAAPLRPHVSSERKKSNKPIIAALNPKDSQESLRTEKVERPDLSDMDPRWKKHYAAVRTKMGGLRPIHSEGQNKIHEILRVFDLSYEYGPCIGVSRLERWQRAKLLGLNPPPEVHEMLLTRQGTEQAEFSQPVFHDEV